MSDRKVIAHVTEIDRQIKQTESSYSYRAIGTTCIFDSYEDLENFRRTIAIENADPANPTARIIDWWWWCD